MSAAALSLLYWAYCTRKSENLATKLWYFLVSLHWFCEGGGGRFKFVQKKKILMISLSPLRSQRMVPGKHPEHHSEEDRESQPIQTFTIPET